MKSARRIAAHLTALPLLAIAVGHATPASAATASNAGFDWGSFAVSTSDPGFAFIRNDGFFGTTVTAFSTDFAADWTTPIAAGDATTSATANAASLAVSIDTPNGSSFAPRSADVTRAGSFNLDANSSVTFSVNANAATNTTSDPADTAFASLSAIGGDAGFYLASIDLTGNGLAQSQNRPLSFMVTNTTGSAITGFLAAEATLTIAAVSVSPVPEPATFALMAAGLALIAGLGAHRGRHDRGG